MKTLVKRKAWILTNFEVAREYMKVTNRNVTAVEVSLRAVNEFTYIKTLVSFSVISSHFIQFPTTFLPYADEV